ncbi:hypothetical protein NBH00_01575 [Paraconexibacter antarcticus]|uniref:Tryptophan-associated transmembrane protein n=1 Tax=Paraconexibacter antarcticus TaxID=2949664 RepID=A0ABY5DTJ3_9ACTN|nr:hypothetical protein [Paraconexibacter antarcticus]UTI64909.1 hypothetical protein NBH00_01575 [Paraconexibacter antarcticus]
MSTRLRRSDARTGWLIAVGGTFATTACVFSTATGIFHPYPASLGWLPPVLGAAAVVAAVALALLGAGRARAVAVGAITAVLLIAPATWAAQTLDHATSSTFPAGGPASAAGGFGGPGAGATGDMFGGSTSLTAALAYAKAHGGGTVAVSSQQGASAAIVASPGPPRTSRLWAASPAARARSRSRGSSTRSAPGGSVTS